VRGGGEGAYSEVVAKLGVLFSLWGVRNDLSPGWWCTGGMEEEALVALLTSELLLRMWSGVTSLVSAFGAEWMSWDRPEKLTPDSEKRELLCSVGGGSTGMWP